MNKKITTYKKVLIVIIVFQRVYALINPAKGTNKVIVMGKTEEVEYNLVGAQWGFIYFFVFLLVLSFIF